MNAGLWAMAAGVGITILVCLAVNLLVLPDETVDEDEWSEGP